MLTLRQTSQFSGNVGNTSYVVNPNDWDSVDYVLILDPSEPVPSFVPRERIVLLCMENPSIWSPSDFDLSNIGIMISPYSNYSDADYAAKRIQGFPCVPWFYGIEFCTNSGLLHRPLISYMELDAMTAQQMPAKPKLLSIITSSKCITAGHSWRISVANKVKSYFGKHVDVYGFGHSPIRDKRNAIDPYTFSLVLENDCIDYYVTEKVVDCLLGWSIPIYGGCSQVFEAVEQSINTIPFGCSVEYALDLIKGIVNSGGISLDCLAQARSSALANLNMYHAVPQALSEL